MHTSPLFLLGGDGEGGGGLNLQPNFQKGRREGGGLTGPQLSDGGCRERGTDFFQGGCNVHIKKLKSEIFNNKKSLQAKIFFSVITKNLNVDI